MQGQTSWLWLLCRLCRAEPYKIDFQDRFETQYSHRLKSIGNNVIGYKKSPFMIAITCIFSYPIISSVQQDNLITTPKKPEHIAQQRIPSLSPILRSWPCSTLLHSSISRRWQMKMQKLKLIPASLSLGHRISLLCNFNLVGCFASTRDSKYLQVYRRVMA